jgi:hypothetical protein
MRRISHFQKKKKMEHSNERCCKTPEDRKIRIRSRYELAGKARGVESPCTSKQQQT